MSLIAMLVRSLRVLFGTAGMLPALGVVALAMMLGGGAMFRLHSYRKIGWLRGRAATAGIIRLVL
jgi:hypothetical protein